MNQTFTSNHLIAFLYNELPMQLSDDLRQVLQSDEILQEEFWTMYQGYLKLPKVTFGPSQDSLDAIRAQARGKLEMA